MIAKTERVEDGGWWGTVMVEKEIWEGKILTSSLSEAPKIVKGQNLVGARSVNVVLMR